MKCLKTIVVIVFSLGKLCNVYAQEEEVRTVCQTWIKGRIALFRSGDITLLNTVNSDKLDELYAIYKEELALLFSEGYSNRRFVKSNEETTIADIKIAGDTAICKMNSLSIMELNLVKTDGEWLVHGENGTYITDAIIKERKEQLIEKRKSTENVLKSRPVLKQITRLKRDITRLYKEQNYSILEDYCAKPVIDFIKEFIPYSLAQESLSEIERKSKLYKSWVGHTRFTDNKVVCKMNNEENRIFHLELNKNKEWIITGFNNTIGSALVRKKMIEDYQDFLRVFGIYDRKKK
ncbi:hypothetical protein [Aquimarina rhabdastrellae]